MSRARPQLGLPLPHQILVGLAGLIALITMAHAQVTYTWNGGDFSTISAVPPPSSTVGLGDTLTISSANDHDYSTVAWTNSGTVNWTGGNLRGGNGSSITNNGTWNDSSAGTYNNDYGGTATTFTNASGATYNKTATGTRTFSILFNNSGTVNIGAGTLQLNGGGTISPSGTFAADSGTVVNFSSGYTISDASRLTGAGTYQVTGGAFSLSGTVATGNLQFLGGNTTGTFSFTNGASWQAGTMNSSATLTNASGSTFTISTSADHDYSQRTLVNNGTVNWTGGNLRGGNGSSITNNGIWNDSASATFNNDYGGAATTFTNAAGATYNKSAAGTASFPIVFNNAGTFNLNAGTLSLTGGGTLASTGTFVAATGTTVNFSNSYTIADGAGLTGAGAYRVTSGTFSLSGAVATGNLQFLGGNTTGTFSFANGASWQAGTFNSAGTTTNASGSTWTISTANDHDYSQRALVNNGTVNWTGGNLRGGNSSSITNNGIWNDSASATFNNDYGGAATTFTNAAGATYNKSATGTTTVGVGFTNQGTLKVGLGTLSFSSALTLSSGGSIEFGLGGITAGTNFGVLSATSGLTLDGTLNVRFAAGFENTVTGTDTFTVLNAASLVLLR